MENSYRLQLDIVWIVSIDPIIHSYCIFTYSNKCIRKLLYLFLSSLIKKLIIKMKYLPCMYKPGVRDFLPMLFRHSKHLSKFTTWYCKNFYFTLTNFTKALKKCNARLHPRTAEGVYASTEPWSLGFITFTTNPPLLLLFLSNTSHGLTLIHTHAVSCFFFICLCGWVR